MSSPNRLLVLSQLFYPELVSTGQTLTELCEELVKLGVDVEVICAPLSYYDRTKSIPAVMTYRGVRIRRLRGTKFPKLNLIGRIVNQVTFSASVFLYLVCDRTRRPLLVVTNPPFLAFICAFLRMIGIGKPYIYLVFDIYPDTLVNLGLTHKHGMLSKIWNYANGITFKFASRIVVIGRCMQEVIMVKLNTYGIPAKEKMGIIHVWSDDPGIGAGEGRSSSFIDRWQLHGKCVVAYSGNMGRFHDMETIMESAKLLSDIKDVVFLFVGEGHKKAWMQKFAKEHRLENCRFHPYVDRRDLGDMLACADIGLVSLMKGQEGLSVPSKTYGLMAAGVPVLGVMGKSSEIAKMVSEESCGIIVEPGDCVGVKNAIMTLKNNAAMAASYGKNGQAAVREKYSLESAARAYANLIADMNSRL